MLVLTKPLCCIKPYFRIKYSDQIVDKNKNHSGEELFNYDKYLSLFIRLV